MDLLDRADCCGHEGCSLVTCQMKFYVTNLCAEPNVAKFKICTMCIRLPSDNAESVQRRVIHQGKKVKDKVS